MTSNYTVVFDAEQGERFEEEVKPLLAEHDCHFVAFTTIDELDIPEQSLIITWLGDEALYPLIPVAAQKEWAIGLLPHPDMNRVRRGFYVADKLEEAVESVFCVESPVESDLMYCNDRLVMGAVMMGNPATMKPAARVDVSIWSKLWNLLVLALTLSKTRLLPYTIETAKESVVKTAALGLAVVYRPGNSDFTKRVVGETEEDEASLNAVILSPRSLFEVMHFLFTRVLPEKPTVGVLKHYLGHVKSERLTISSPEKLEYSIDGEFFSDEQVEIRVEDGVLQVLSDRLPPKSAQKEIKESVRVSGLPKGEAVKALAERPLPWIHHADQEELKETFVTLHENAQTSESYLVLMILSTLLATVGLFANSAPVIIGAMILAPLMAPIISLSMGVLRQSSELVVVSGKTLLVGVILGLLCGTLLTWLLPLHAINNEISARLTPTLLDLGVAIISGIAGAYAYTRSEVAKSLAGVAISVALVPPLAVAGIGIGWMEWPVFYGAFLLFLTNLAGIVLAAAATFLVMGFSPFYLAKKGILLSLAFVAVVSVPLVFAFGKMVEEQRIVNLLEGWQVEGTEIRDVRIRSADPRYLSVRLLSEQPLKGGQIDVIKKQVEQRLGESIRLEATTAVVRD